MTANTGYSIMLRLFYLFCLLTYQTTIFAGIKKPTDENVNSFKWQIEQHNLSLTLVALKPEYVNAVFAARGLPKDVVADISTYCVFGTIIKNTSDTAISSQLSNWKIVTPDNNTHHLKLKENWVKQWRAKGIGFRWLLLSNQQNFDEGDWIQGFITVALPPGHRFDLHYSWQQQAKQFNNTIKGMRCAPNTSQSP